MNVFAVDGVIKKALISSKVKPSVILMVQFGPDRETGDNRAVEFINVIAVRVPNYIYEKTKDFLIEGQRVDVKGRLQGVLKGSVHEGVLVSECVAESVRQSDPYIPEEDMESEGESKLADKASA